MNTCPVCSESVHELANFCRNCGAELSGPGSVPLAADPPPPAKLPHPWWWVAGAGFFLLLGMVLLITMEARQKTRPLAAAATSVVNVSRNNLKQIGLGFYYYHDLNAAFPAGGIIDENGAGSHSWQTEILPYFGESGLYRSIRYDLAWDDPQNRPYFTLVFQTYTNPANPQTQNTLGYGLSHYAGNSLTFTANQNLRMQDILDGTSNTMFAGEVADGFKAWGDPTNVRDLTAGIASDTETFGGPDGIGGTFLMADGSVRFISNDVEPAVLKALSTPNGSEPAPPEFSDLGKQ